MSSLTANGSASRLLCRAYLRTHAALGPTRRQALDGHAIVVRRQYASYRISPTVRPPSPPRPNGSTPASSPAPSRTTPRLPAQSNWAASKEPARLIFSSKDVPPLQDWMNHLESLGNTDLTPLHCMEGAQTYVRVATQHESQWRHTLEKEHKLSPYLLHWIGVALICGNTAPRWRLGTHMLRSASELGYMPSTLTLVRIFSSMPPHMSAKAFNTIMYRQAHARFKESLVRGTDPNALTLRGIIYAKSGSDAKAMAMFCRATEAWQEADRKEKGLDEQAGDKPGAKGAQALAATSERDTGGEATKTAPDQDHTLPPPREPRWEWEISSVLGQANILVKNPSTAMQAKEMFRVAALELDNPHGFFMLTKLMGGPRDSPERRMYLLKAAISGEAEACREMGELEKLAAERTTRSEERAEHELISKEWFRLAEGEDLSAYVKAEDVDDGNIAS